MTVWDLRTTAGLRARVRELEETYDAAIARASKAEAACAELRRENEQLRAELGATLSAPDEDDDEPEDLAGTPFPDRPGYVTGRCGHAVAGSEWKAGFRVCEHCPADANIYAPRDDAARLLGY